MSRPFSFSFSLRWAFVGVAYFAVIAAALTDGAAHWFAILALATVFAMLVSLLALVYRRGEQRSFWLGFAVFGWAYMVLTHGPAALTDAMPTYKLFWNLYPVFRRTVPLDTSKPEPSWVRETDSENGRTVAVIVGRHDFVGLGHSICALASAVLGGSLGRWFFLTRERDTGEANLTQ